MSTIPTQVREEQTNRDVPRPPRIRRRRRGRAVVGGLVLVVVAAGGGFVASTMAGGGGDKTGTGESTNTAPTALAAVEQKKLTAQTRVNGTLGYAGLYEVVNRASGTITRLPAVGQVIGQGRVLYRVDGKPVILLRGAAVPAYRSLWRTMKGADVRQLNAALVALGYADKDDLDPKSQYFGWSTYYAMLKLQKKFGLSRTGGLELGQAVFLPAKQIRVTKVNASYGATAPSGPIMEASSTDRHVTVALETSQVSGIKVGDKVTVTLPTLKETPGRVASIGTVAKKATSGSPTVDVRIKLSRPRDTGRLDQAPVQVAIVSASADDVLAVPVNALLALAGGGYAIEVVQPDNTHKLYPVTLGLFDDSAGMVEIEGAGVTAGQKIVVPAA
ncbi:efflux RND transporter periplasmic adaptor subunit [Sphaerisporangium aureirubrum]|uniref:Efflux RND transporter periplasmic adaptor subunit n=1 Tax=Sphaerisporangium aureirubrum TaxID=1544736 RepID=A0ABW1NHJ0_9ACTN